MMHRLGNGLRPAAELLARVSGSHVALVTERRWPRLLALQQQSLSQEVALYRAGSVQMFVQVAVCKAHLCQAAPTGSPSAGTGERR